MIEQGWIDKYILGLTSESESEEVERLASLYPEVQQEINAARSRICGKFNRQLTQPAMRHSFLTKRRVLYSSGFVVLAMIGGFLFMCKKHFSLQAHYTRQCEKLAVEEAKVAELSSYTRKVSEQGNFMHAEQTKRIKLKGCDNAPESEVLVFQCRRSGKMMMRVVDLPSLGENEVYEVWARQPDQRQHLVGTIQPPVRFDSLYVLDTALHSIALQINRRLSGSASSEAVCLASMPQ